MALDQSNASAGHLTLGHWKTADTNYIDQHIAALMYIENEDQPDGFYVIFQISDGGGSPRYMLQHRTDNKIQCRLDDSTGATNDTVISTGTFTGESGTPAVDMVAFWVIDKDAGYISMNGETPNSVTVDPGDDPEEDIMDYAQVREMSAATFMNNAQRLCILGLGGCPHDVDNEVLWSEDGSNAAWLKDFATATSTNAVQGPTGSDVTLLTEDSTASQEHRMRQTPAGVPASTITGRASIRRATSGTRNVRVMMWNATDATLAYATVDPDDGSIQASSGTVDVVQNGQWWDVFITGTATVTGTGIYIGLADGTTVTYNGDNTSNMYVANAGIYDFPRNPPKHAETTTTAVSIFEAGTAPTDNELLRASIAGGGKGEDPTAIWGDNDGSFPYVMFKYEMRDDAAEFYLLDHVGRDQIGLEPAGNYVNATDAATFDKADHVRTDLSTNITWAAGTAQTVQINNPSHGAFIGSITADAYYLIGPTSVDATASDTAITAGIIDEASGNEHIYIPDGWYISVFHGTNSGTLSLTPTNATPHINRNNVTAATHNSVDIEVDKPRYLHAGDLPVNAGTSVVVAKPEVVTNMILQSEDITTTWSNFNTTLTANATTGPFHPATTIADKLADENDAQSARETSIFQNVTITADEDYCFSAYVKQDQLSWVLLRTTQFDNDDRTYFDVGNGVLGTKGTNHVSYGMSKEENGYWRCWVVFQSTTDLVGRVDVGLADADLDFNVDQDGTSSVFVTGLQVNKGSLPGIYVPTTTTTASNSTTLSLALPEHPTGGTEDYILHDQGINEFSKPTVTLQAATESYGSSTDRLANTVSASVSTTETRIPLPTTTGRFVFMSTIDCYIEPGNSTVVTSTTSRIVYKGEIAQFEEGAHTHLAIKSVNATESGNYSLSGSVVE